MITDRIWTPLSPITITYCHLTLLARVRESRHALEFCNEPNRSCDHFTLYLFSAVKKMADKYPGLIEVPKEDGFTSLHLAAFNNHTEIVRTLLLTVRETRLIAWEPQRGSRLFFTIAAKSQNLSGGRSETCTVDCVFYIRAIAVYSRPALRLARNTSPKGFLGLLNRVLVFVTFFS